MDKDWLNEKWSVADAEAKNMVSNSRLGPLPVPFGFANAQWVGLLDEMREGDELWSFSSPAESWQQLCGQAGFVVIRDGKVVASITTSMN